MLWRRLQNYIHTYDTIFTSVVALLPARLLRLSSILGKVTLPSIWAITLLTICFLLDVNGFHALAVLGTIIVACIPIGTILKLLIRRSRPKTLYVQNMRIKSYSFPSSHAYAATLAGGFLALVCLSVFSSLFSIITASLCFVLSIAIGISRIHVGAHYPTDVTAGWLLGTAVLYVVVQATI